MRYEKAGHVHVLHVSTYPFNGFTKAYIYPYIVCYKYIELLQDII